MTLRRVVIILTVLAATAAALTAPAGSLARTRRSEASQQGSHLYVMFLPGLCGWPLADRFCHNRVSAADRAHSTFSTLQTSLSAAGVRYSPLYFSYDPSRSDSYTVGQTHQAVARSAGALNRQLRDVVHRDGKAVFLLVGYSLGGVVAADWAVTDGRDYGLDGQGLLSRVQSIITLDSPLRGISDRLTGNIAVQLFGGAVWYSLQPDSETIKGILYFPLSWWRSTGHLHTVANQADRIVPPSESTLGDSRVVSDGKCPRDLVVLSSCHGAVMSDVALNHWIACHWTAGAAACGPRPTSTPTPVPTLTPLPTTTPTLTMTITLPPPPRTGSG